MNKLFYEKVSSWMVSLLLQWGNEKSPLGGPGELRK